MAIAKAVLAALFQFTLPHGERPPKSNSFSKTSRFQFTLPHGERQGGQATLDLDTRFNSRSRMGSDATKAAQDANTYVSIHAPAWGATGLSGLGNAPLNVSIHAPAWGATSGAAAVTMARPSFNSRSRMGSDAREKAVIAWDSVSIHAPAWGATRYYATWLPRREFQFTLPHGERRLGAAASMAALRFNSRSRMGSDTRPRGRPRLSYRFQFTLPHGERQVPRMMIKFSVMFQFTLPHGERRVAAGHARPLGRFQFTLPHGERPKGGEG